MRAVAFAAWSGTVSGSFLLRQRNEEAGQTAMLPNLLDRIIRQCCWCCCPAKKPINILAKHLKAMSHETAMRLEDKSWEKYNEKVSGNISQETAAELRGQSLEEYHAKDAAYWAKQSADVDGVLGGFAFTSRPDLEASEKVLDQILGHDRKGDRVLDCGAGVGRITQGLLLKRFEHVEVLEPDKHLIDKAREILREKVDEKNFYQEKVEDFVENHAGKKYSCIWSQWVFLYLTDEELVAWLKKAKDFLEDGGFIFSKENVLPAGEKEKFVLDGQDNGLTRSVEDYQGIFADAGYDLVNLGENADQASTQWFPNLYPLHMFVLKPKKSVETAQQGDATTVTD